MEKQDTYTIDYWKNTYPKTSVTMEESSFAQFCLPRIKGGKDLLSIGCGNGRDARFFERMGLNVSAFDINPLNNVSFKFNQFDLLSKKDRFGYDQLFDYVYCRFVLHAVTEDVEDYILLNASRVLKEQGFLFIEARSDKGSITSEINQHYRRLINSEKLLQKLRRLGFRIHILEEASGLSPYNGEDPVLIRIVADKLHRVDPVIAEEMLLLMKKVLDKNNIPFFLIFGTLLGAYRDKAIIPHDHDVDIGLFYLDRNKVLTLVRKKVFASEGFQFKSNGFATFHSFEYKGERIDLFFFRKVGLEYRSVGAFKIHSSHFTGGLASIKFLGTTFKTIRNIETYLEDRYGKDWRIPVIGKHAAI